MVTLTDAYNCDSQLGGSGTIAYDKLVLYHFTLDLDAKTVNASARMVDSNDATQSALEGSLRIDINANEARIDFPTIGFTRTVVLAEAAAVLLTGMATLQAGFENGLINLGLVAGAQSAGL